MSSILEIPRVSAIVVTYNPVIKELKENIESYSNQVDLVILVDNSTDLTVSNKVAELGDKFENIKVIGIGHNAGIAKAQNIGVQYAIDCGYEYFLEMDQDSKLSPDYINSAYRVYQDLTKKEKVAALGGVAIAGNGEIFDGKKLGVGVIPIDKTLSSGLFYKKDAYDIVGPKIEDMFIDLVDWEWCWRAKALGLTTFVNTEMTIEHAIGDGNKQFLLLTYGVPSPIRHYYAFRNSLFLMKKNYVPIGWKIKTLVILCFKLMIYGLLLEQGKKRVTYMLRGIKDAITLRFGQYE